MIALLAGSAIMYVFFGDYLRQEEKQQILATAHIVKSHILEKEKKYQGSLNDWSHWDDLYSYLNSTNPDFINMNMTEDTFINLDMNLILIFNNDKTIKNTLFYDLSQSSFSEAPKALATNIQTDLKLMKLDQDISYIIKSDGKYYIVAFSKITDSMKEMPSNGYMVFGRIVDNDIIGSIQDETDSQIIISSEDEMDNGIVNGLNSIKADSNQIHLIQINEKSGMVECYSELQNSDGVALPIFLKIAKNRDFYNGGISHFRQLELLFAILYAFITFILFIILKKYVSKPILDITQQVSSVDLTKDRFKQINVTGKDELSELGITVNTMLKKLELSQSDFKTSEERFRIIFENAPLGIGLFDFFTGQVYQVNHKFAEITGYSEEELAYLDWQALTYPDDMAENLRYRELIIAKKSMGLA